MSREFAKRLPEAPISVPVKNPKVKIIPRVETLEVLPCVKIEDLEKQFNLFTASDLVKVNPEDSPDKLWSYFTTRIAPSVSDHRSGNLRFPDMAQYSSDEFIRHLHLNTRYMSKFLDDPSLLGSTIYNQHNFDKKRKFTTTERGYIDLDNSLQGIVIITKTNVENLSMFAKSTNLEFILLKERMKHFEDLLVYLDATIAKMFDSNKAMQVALMKAILETRVTGLRCAETLTVAANALLDKKHGSFTKEEVAELLFKAKKTDVSEDLARDSVTSIPTDEEFLESAIQRINELAINDIEARDDSILITKEMPKASRNIQEDFSPLKEFLEAKREPIVSPEVDHAHVVNKLAEMRKNRFPAVNAPIVQVTLKSSYAQINQAFQESDGKTGPERRHNMKKPPKRSDLPSIDEEDQIPSSPPPLPDTDHPMPSPPPSSPNNLLKIKHKLQTARKSTTPRKRSKSLGSIQGVEVQSNSGYEELEETLSEIEISDDEVQIVGEVTVDKLEGCVVKQELIESSTSPNASDES